MVRDTYCDGPVWTCNEETSYSASGTLEPGICFLTAETTGSAWVYLFAHRETIWGTESSFDIDLFLATPDELPALSPPALAWLAAALGAVGMRASSA